MFEYGPSDAPRDVSEGDDYAHEPLAESSADAVTADASDVVDIEDNLDDTDTLAPEDMFSRSERVPARAMAGFIVDGLTENDILDIGEQAGIQRPRMDLTLADLDTCMPFISQASEATAQLHAPGVKVVHAARDADLLSDDYTTAHPDSDSVLLPASIHLLDSPDMENPELARGFLAEYGIDEAWLADPNNRLLVIDTGYGGGVFARVPFALSDTFGLPLQELRARTDGRLICSTNQRVEQLMPVDHPSVYSRGLPKLNQHIGNYSGINEGLAPDSWRLASALQMMPKFHGQYRGLTTTPDGKVIPTTEHEAISNNVDRVTPGEFYVVNTSPVNPVAATITQFRVVRNALRRTGQMRRWV